MSVSNAQNGDFLIHNSYTFWISRLASLMQEEFNHRLAGEGVTWPQWMVLNVLHHQLAGTPAMIADTVGVDRSAVTRLLDRLEKKELLLREHDKLDRRSVKVRMTASGQALVARLNHLAHEHQEHFLNSMHKTEHRGFKGNVQKLLKLAGVDSIRLWK
ncbi:MarR family winged helix-turn-helix transcriptional regulator [Gilvimarinus sp. F26214L]|uniref:MarR family winged helix-turn-helix transcriptional regulator n=1 Tax=Gilvimarinus sp. DZF01 TaxID=3461371 RepID=UPI0040462E7F